MEDPTNNIAFAQSFTLYMKQIGMVTEMATRFGKKRSRIVQEAIESYYEKTVDQPAASNVPNSAQPD